MDNARRLRDPNSKCFDVSHTSIKRAIGFGVADGLIKDFREVVEQSILLLDLQSEYAIQEARDIALVFFAHDFLTVPDYEQPDVAQRLPRIFKIRYGLSIGNPP